MYSHIISDEELVRGGEEVERRTERGRREVEG
jgi:hypothetical protein